MLGKVEMFFPNFVSGVPRMRITFRNKSTDLSSTSRNSLEDGLL